MKEIGKIENKVKLYIQQGSNFALVFDLDEFTTSLTDAVGRGHIRRTVDSVDVEAEFDCVIDVGEKEMVATVDAAESSAIVLDQSSDARRVNTLMAYDIELEFSTGTVVRLMWGEVEIIPEATRSA
jgi:hypothetical protein